MQKNLKKCLSLVLVFVMMLSMFPFTYANDPTAGETATDDTLVEFLNLAKSQVGYVEPEDGRTMYDDWWGATASGDWGMKFVSYCLETAGISVLPLESDIPTWVNILSNAVAAEYYHDYCDDIMVCDPTDHDHYTPGKFDIIVMDYDGDEIGDHVGIVVDTKYVDGAYTVVMVVPNHDGQVALVEQSVSASWCGVVPLDAVYQTIRNGVATMGNQSGGTGSGGGYGTSSNGSGLQYTFAGVDMQVLYYHYKDVYNGEKMYQQVINSVTNYNTAADNAMNAAGQKLDGSSYDKSSIFHPTFLTDNLYFWQANSGAYDMHEYSYNNIYRLKKLPDGFYAAAGSQTRDYGEKFYYIDYLWYNKTVEADTRVVDADMAKFFKRIIAGNSYGAWDKNDVDSADSLYAKMLKACGASDTDIQNYLRAYEGKMSVTDEGDTLIPVLVWKFVIMDNNYAKNGAGVNNSFLYTPYDFAYSFSKTKAEEWWKTAYPWDYTAKTGTSLNGGTATIYRSSVYTGIAQHYYYSDGSSQKGRCACPTACTYGCKILWGTGHDSQKSHTSFPKELIQSWGNGAGFVNAISNEGYNTSEYGRESFHYRNYWACYEAASGGVTIKKVSSANQNVSLSGATFKLYKDYDPVTKTFSNPITAKDYYSGSTTKGDKGYVDAATRTTGADGIVEWTGLFAGKYWMEEVVAPSGYKKSENGIEVNVVKGGKTQIVTNDVTFKTVNIKKSFENAPSNCPKAGWLFEIYDASGTTLISTCQTDASGVAMAQLEPGNTYTIKEVGGPSGWWDNTYFDKAAASVPVTVVVAEDSGDVIEIGITNIFRGRISVTKTTNTGKNLKGWKFGIYDGSTLVETLTTDANGKATSGLLTVGKTYTVKEITGSDMYWSYDTDSESIKVVANETKNVTFNNIHYGRLTWTKTTNTGSEKGGWKFGVYTDANCTTLAKYKDGSAAYAYSLDDGSVTSGLLLPGTYYVQEIDESAQHPEWSYDNTIKSGKVVAGKDSPLSGSDTSFDNTKYGRVQVQKNTNTGTRLEGWVFYVYTDSGCTTVAKDRNGATAKIVTNSSGYGISGYLLPGTYWVKEDGADSAEADEYWVYDSTKPSVNVVGGQDSAVLTFTNTEYGRFTLKKRTNTGADLDKWVFTVYTDANCTQVAKYKDGTNATLTSDSNGNAVSGYLLPGTYYVKETGGDRHKDPYWKPDADVEKVVVTAGSTNQTAIIFDNTHYGRIVIEKSTNTGANLDAWIFTVYTDANCETVATDKAGNRVTMETGATGVTTSGYLLPGTYYVKETGGSRYSDDYYWTVSEEVKSVQVVAGQDVRPAAANGVFTNTHYGRLKVVKDMDSVELNGKKKLGGWQFQITRNSDGADMGIYVTNENGEFITDKLLPGEYTITEIIDEVNGYYYCETTNPMKAVVVEGQTKLVGGRERPNVSFVNALRPMKIVLDKVNHMNQPLEGVEFSLEWSVDGQTWTRVKYSNAENVVLGNCGSAGLSSNGTLKTDKNGHLEFVNLYPGVYYRVTEENTLSGYTLLAEPHDIAPEDVDITTLSYEMRVVNTPGYSLPESGVSDMSTNLMVIGGTCAAMLVMFGLFCIYTNDSVFRRRKAMKNKK